MLNSPDPGEHLGESINPSSTSLIEDTSRVYVRVNCKFSLVGARSYCFATGKCGCETSRLDTLFCGIVKVLSKDAYYNMSGLGVRFRRCSLGKCK